MPKEPLIEVIELPEVKAKIHEADELAKLLGEKLKELNIPFSDHHLRDVSYPHTRIGSFLWEDLPPHQLIAVEKDKIMEFIKRLHEMEGVTYVSLESEQHYATYEYLVFISTKSRLYIVIIEEVQENGKGRI